MFLDLHTEYSVNVLLSYSWQWSQNTINKTTETSDKTS